MVRGGCRVAICCARHAELRDERTDAVLAGVRRLMVPPEPATAMLYLDVGITGWDLGDCLTMLRVLTHVDALPPIRTVAEDVDVSQLHPRLGLGVPVWRGVWHPPMNLQSSGRWDAWAPWRDVRR